MSDARASVRIDRVELTRPGPVGWFSVRLLVSSGIKALVSSLVGAQTGRRELLAALDTGPKAKTPYAVSAQPDAGGVVWVDYVADLGDGFDATHSVAWLLGRDYLFLKEPGKAVAQPVPQAADAEIGKDGVPDAVHVLPRGDLLIFGGDEVYPYASQADYAERTYGPYYAARPWGSPVPGAPASAGARPLVAIPGNHDWYDGLISFVRMFCQPDPTRWIGAWFVVQPRSYFAIQLPHHWWIWGIDIASEDDVDPPQLRYFRDQAGLMAPGDKVVICTAKPSWVECAKKDGAADVRPRPQAWDKLAKIATLAEGAQGDRAGVKVFISGDLHHYARHETDDGKQFITCGGGGAYTLGTTLQPDDLDFGNGKTAQRQSAFPSVPDSRAMRGGALKICFRHKLFCALVAVVMLFLVWLLQSDSRLLMALPLESRSIDVPFLDAMRSPKAWLIVTILSDRPGTVLAFLGVLIGFCGFARSGAKRETPVWQSVLVGSLHFFAQLWAAIFLAVGVDVFFDAASGTALTGTVRDLLFPVVALGLGTFCHGLLFGAYLYLANSLVCWHQQEVYSSQAIQDWKCFLRMKVDAHSLSIYPIGLRTVQTQWLSALKPSAGRLSKMAEGVSSFFTGDRFDVPEGTTHLYRPKTPLKPELIEQPVVIGRTRAVESSVFEPASIPPDEAAGGADVPAGEVVA